MLHLVPCLQCDAINNEADATCYRCGAVLAAQAAVTQAAAQANANAERAYAIEALERPVAAAPPPAPPPPIRNDRNDAQLASTAPTAPPTNDEGHGSFVVPPDESRLAAVRTVAADARRGRFYRSALIVLLSVATASIMYYEYFPGDPLGDSLRAVQARFVNMFGQRAADKNVATPAAPAPVDANVVPEPAASAPPAIPEASAPAPVSSPPPESVSTEPPADESAQVQKAEPAEPAPATTSPPSHESAVEAKHEARTPPPKTKDSARRKTRPSTKQ